MSRCQAPWSIRLVSRHYWRKTRSIRVSPSELAVVALLCLTEGAGCQRPLAGQANPKTPSPVAAGMPSGDRVQGWQKDVDTLMEEIKLHHYIYRTKPLPQACVQRAQELKKSVSKFSDERMLIELQGLMSHLGDGHCYILPFGAPAVEVECLPLQFYLFSDGLFVVGADNGYERWLGRRLVRLGPVTVSDAMTGIADYISRDNPMGLKWVGPLFIRFRGTLEVLGLEPGAREVALAFDTPNGTITEEKIPFVPAPQFHGVPKLGPPKLPGAGVPPLYLTSVATPYWIRELPDEKALYIQFNQVMNAPQENLKTFALRLGRILNERPPQLLVVDVRHNNGGNAELRFPLVDVLKSFEGSNPNAKLVVITGRNTFSAAQIFIADVNHQTRAIFAGEPSSSKPNFVGEENEVVLPWSGARGSISNRYHETIPGDQRIWIEPEVKVELSSGDYFANRDPVLHEVLKRFGNSARH
jgi:hypothetical protein